VHDGSRASAEKSVRGREHRLQLEIDQAFLFTEDPDPACFSFVADVDATPLLPVEDPEGVISATGGSTSWSVSDTTCDGAQFPEQSAVRSGMLEVTFEGTTAKGSLSLEFDDPATITFVADDGS